MNAALRPEAAGTERPTAGRRVRAAAIVAVAWLAIASPIFSSNFRCPTARITHHPCPGCGLTRAMLLLFDGHVGASLAMHALAVPTTLAYGFIALTSVSTAWRAGVPWALFEATWGRRALYALMAVMTLDFLLWIARGCGLFGGPVPV